MNSKMVGDIGETKALYEFTKRGIPVSIPFGDNQRYDMIAEFNGKLNRIQCKVCNEVSNGAIKCNVCSSTMHTNNPAYQQYEDIEYFFFYNQTYDTMALVPFEVVKDNRRQASFRLEPAKNGQTKGVRMWSDYELDKIIVDTPPEDMLE